jgi:hypothetical protein
MPWKIAVVSQLMWLVLAPGPNATLSPTSLTFSTQPIGIRSKAQTLTLKNNGTATLNITKISIGGKDAGDFAQTHTCGTMLSEGATCSINVTFKPTASGTRTTTLSVTDNAADSPQMVSLSGTGTAGRCTPAGAQCPPQRPPCCPGLMCVLEGDRAFCEGKPSEHNPRADSVWDRLNPNTIE